MREQLLAWLDAGCPNYMFDMEWGLAIITEPGTGPDEKPECGTVCCIAGYVAGQVGVRPKLNESANWNPNKNLDRAVQALRTKSPRLSGRQFQTNRIRFIEGDRLLPAVKITRIT